MSVFWTDKKTLSHSSLAIAISHMPNTLSLKEKGKKNWYNSPSRTTFTTLSYTSSGLSNDLINMTATVVQSCPEATELEPWQANWISTSSAFFSLWPPMWITAGLDLSWLWWDSFSCCWSYHNVHDKPIVCVRE